MTEQHYGRAPCGCTRAPAEYGTGGASLYALCQEHTERPWLAAEALEAGLRAIAGWRHAEGRFRATCGGPLCVQVQEIDGPGVMIGYVFHREGCATYPKYEATLMHAEKPALQGGAACHIPPNRKLTKRKGYTAEDLRGSLLESFSQENIERWVRASLGAGGSSDTEMPLVPGSLAARLNTLLDLADPRGRGLADVDPILTREQVRELLVGSEPGAFDRTRCYFCGAELGTSLMRCSRCGNEQPPGD